jgi:hypothetical protein
MATDRNKAAFSVLVPVLRCRLQLPERGSLKGGIYVAAINWVIASVAVMHRCNSNGNE